MQVKRPFSSGGDFLLGATSYVLEAGLVENAEYLRGIVDDMELVLFHTPEASNLPGANEIERLVKVKLDSDFGYTVHLPVDISPEPESKSLDLAKEVVRSTLPLEPRAFVLHLNGRRLSPEPSAGELASWRNGAMKAVAELCDSVGDPSLIAIENLERWPPEWFLPMLDLLPVSLTVDVGHLWVQGRDPVPYIKRWISRIGVVHLHGVHRSDHVSLSFVEKEELLRVMGALRHFEGVLTLEVFGIGDFESSLEALESCGFGVAP